MDPFAVRRLAVTAIVLGFLAINTPSQAQPKSWSGVAGDTLWSTTGNWLPAGVPGANDNVTFTNEAATDAQLSLGGAVNNTVDTTFGGTIKSLWYANITGFHNTILSKQLLVQGTSAIDVAFVSDDGHPAVFFVGSGQADAAGDQVTTSIAGESLMINNSNAAISVMQASATSGAHRATLDLSQLGVFTCNVSNLLVGHDFGIPITRPTGTLILAASNSITAKMISVGDAYQNAGAISYIYLGQDNALDVDRIRIALHKCIGTVAMQDGLVGATVKMRASNGLGRQTSWEIGDEYEPDPTIGYFTSNQSTGILDLTGATVDALVDKIVIGRGQTNAPTRTGDGNGTLTFGTGAINANQVQVGIQLSGGGSVGRGTLNINNDSAILPAKLTINGDLIMAVQLPGNTESTGSTAAINVNGGILEIAGNAIDGGGNTTLTIDTGGVVDLMPAGDSSRGNISVDTLNLGGGTLTHYSTLALSTISMTGAIMEFVVEQGGTLSPAGDTVGTLDITSGSLRIEGTLALDIRKSGNTFTADKITGLVTYGGALEVRRLGDALTVGDKFTLFAAAIAPDTFSSITLPSAGPGLSFTNKLAVDGTIEVISNGEPTDLPRLTIVQAGTSLTISWPVAYSSFVLRDQTNSTGIANNWGPVSGVTGNQMTLQLNPANKTAFFDLIQQ
jgi:hypothetical protein